MQERAITVNRKERYFRHYLQSAVSQNLLSQSDSDMWNKYITYKAVTNHISPAYRSVHVTAAVAYRKYSNVPYADLTDDVWINSINEFLVSDEYKVNTKNRHLDILKHFLLWHISEGNIPGLSAKAVSSVSSLKAPVRTKTEADLISQDDIYQLLKAPLISPKLAAIISLLYWTGCRSGELLSLRWKDLHFNSPTLDVIIPPYKTNPERFVVTAEALTYMAQWRSHYPREIPGGPNGDNFVFVSCVNGSTTYEQMSYQNLYVQIRTLSKKILGRELHPHQFRASHITNMSASGVSDMVNKMTHWGHISTNMLSVYSIPSKDMIKTELMRASGIKTEEEKKTVDMIACPKCGAINRGNTYCGVCGTPLVASAIHRKAQFDEELARINTMYDTQTLLSNAAKQLGTSSDLLITELTKLLTSLKSGAT